MHLGREDPLEEEMPTQSSILASFVEDKVTMEYFSAIKKNRMNQF